MAHPAYRTESTRAARLRMPDPMAAWPTGVRVHSTVPILVLDPIARHTVAAVRGLGRAGWDVVVGGYDRTADAIAALLGEDPEPALGYRPGRRFHRPLLDRHCSWRVARIAAPPGRCRRSSDRRTSSTSYR